MPLNPLLQRAFKQLKKLFTKPPEHPDDPYAVVGAPVVPKTPRLSAKAAAVPERYDFH